jgi:hypothetical protein
MTAIVRSQLGVLVNNSSYPSKAGTDVLTGSIYLDMQESGQLKLHLEMDRCLGKSGAFIHLPNIY